jgi:uncharacterized protein (UPF0264 family)
MVTRLLVSVRSATEAAVALAGGADLIDVKEPRRGPLGRAEPAVIAAVVAAVGGRVPVSAALGELRDANDWDGVPAEVRYVKWGLCGLSGRPWRERLLTMREQSARRLVPVAYADHLTADSPPPAEVVAFSARTRLSPVLIDTFRKDGTSLLDVLGLPQIVTLVRACHDSGLRVALAGSLTAEAIQRLSDAPPDWFAVRSAACDGGRGGIVSERRVRELATLIRKKESGGANPRRTGPTAGINPAALLSHVAKSRRKRSL